MLLRALPSVSLLALLLLVAPLWRWSRGWGWAPAGMIGVGFVTVLAFTFAVQPA